MPEAMSVTGTRRSADERRAELIKIAIRHFALHGYKGTSTDLVAKEAGISQPYLFRLFGTKRDLFLACHWEMHGRIRDTFVEAARGLPQEERMRAMGQAYGDLLADRNTLLFQMQSYAACSDPDIQAQVRECYRALVNEVARLTGSGPAELWDFFSNGMLLNVIASLQLEEIAGEEEWAAAWMEPGTLLEESH